MNEPAVDLGILLAVVSSYKDIVIDDKVLVFGEVGLSGEVRAVSMAEQRVQEAKKTGLYHSNPSGSMHEKCRTGNRNHPDSGGEHQRMQFVFWNRKDNVRSI